MNRLRYLTRETVEAMRRSIGTRLDWYYSPGVSACPYYLATDTWREAAIETQSMAESLKVSGDKPSESDASNAMIVYRTLCELTPQQAADERLWVYLSHFGCAVYVAKRWLGTQDEDHEKAARKVANHFFARDSRGFTRDHGVSRLWWLGFIAHEVHPDDPRLFLDIVLHRQDVRSALIERPSVSMNRHVLRGIFAVMCDHWEDDRKLFKREVFRAWMVNLNRRGGVVLLDALSEDPLTRLLGDEAKHALEAEGGGQP